MSDSPGGAKARRPLHFMWIADCSGSMNSDGKIQALNNAIREAIPHLQDAAADNAYADILVRVMAFATGVRWHIGQPTPVQELSWVDLTADGYSDMGAALAEVAVQLRALPQEGRYLPPALVLISDGQPTDDFGGGLQALMDEPWGRNAVRLAVAIGRDADLGVLERFIGRPEIEPVSASNPEQLVQLIRWASTVASKVASAPRLGGADGAAPSVRPPAIVDDPNAATTW
jgi:uncharacterized protein YegL